MIIFFVFSLYDNEINQPTYLPTRSGFVSSNIHDYVYMYPYVFPPQWIEGFWYHFFHPSLFGGINKNWDWGEILWLEKIGGEGIWGERPPKTPCITY